MREPTFAQVSYPWKASIDLRSPAPARFYSNLIAQGFRCGLPASRRFGPAQAWLARRGIPTGVAERVVRRFPARPRPDVERLLDAVGRDWAGYLAAGARIPADPGPLSALAIERAAALTVFVFAGEDAPSLVLKVPKAAHEGTSLERNALELARAVPTVPLFLGETEGALVQEGVRGHALPLIPLTPDGAASAQWGTSLEQVADAFMEISRATVVEGSPDGAHGPVVEAALAAPNISRAVRSRIDGAFETARGLGRCVLKHSDTSPQNCLFDDGRLTGIVDWEMAVPRGLPGFDIWNTALSYLEHCLGLRGWSDDYVVDAFRRAWPDAPLFVAARAKAREAAESIGVDAAHVEDLEVAYFARRLGGRLRTPDFFPTTANVAAKMVEHVCGS